jgi:hypothetical protein
MRIKVRARLVVEVERDLPPQFPDFNVGTLQKMAVDVIAGEAQRLRETGCKVVGQPVVETIIDVQG